MSLVLYAIKGGHHPRGYGCHFDEVEKSIEILIRFDCISQAKQSLILPISFLPKNGSQRAFRAFVLTSRLNDIECAYRLLLRGHIWCFNRSNNALHPENWRSGEANSLRPSWVWAWIQAVAICEKRTGYEDEDWKTERFWRGLVGEFLGNLMVNQ
jgi:hypothetical protein